MVGEIRIYFEGHPRLKEGFDTFLRPLKEKARANRVPFRLIAGRGKATTIADHRKAQELHPASWNLLLVDAEGPGSDHGPENHFEMIQLMEAWFLADREKLQEYFGRDFHPKALPGDEKQVESIPKADIINGLDRATEQTKKGKYTHDKLTHANEILKCIRLERVRAAAPECGRLFTTIQERLSS